MTYPIFGDKLARDMAQHRVVLLSTTIGHADLTASAVSQAINLGSALPTGAYVIGHTMTLTTAFSGGSAGSVTVDIGGTDADAIVDGADVFTGAASPKAGTAGINPTGKFSGQQLTATFVSDVNVVALTAGSLTIDILYCVPAEV